MVWRLVLDYTAIKHPTSRIEHEESNSNLYFKKSKKSYLHVLIKSF